MLRYHLIQRAKYGLSALEWRLEVGRVPVECSDRLSSDHACPYNPQSTTLTFQVLGLISLLGFSCVVRLLC